MADELIGKVFGRLTVVKKASTNTRKVKWYCECECGGHTIVGTASLKSGNTKSCGCLNREISRIVNTKHGESHTRLYKIWDKIIQRCTNPNVGCYERYGGRGIKVCDEWLNDYSKFSAWAKSNGYSEKLSIDRIDVNGNYEPSNCRWATEFEQSRNKRSNRNYSYNGKTQCLEDWAIEYKINSSTLRKRISRGWSFEKAITTPVI